MEDNLCPLCGSTDKCSSQDVFDWIGRLINCNTFHLTCLVHQSVDEEFYGDSPTAVKQRFNAITEFLMRNPYAPRDKHGRTPYWGFYYDESIVGKPSTDTSKINLAQFMRDYPTDFGKRIEKALINLSVCYPHDGEEITESYKDCTILYCDSFNSDKASVMLGYLHELGYLKPFDSTSYRISAKGWQKIGELRKAENEINQGFIAMAFCDETKAIGEAFHTAINACGYTPRRIDQKEHNNQIVPEIFYEIQRSKFLVVDVTVPNYGAYYEAGYGEALKKQVIVCCRADVFSDEDRSKKPHFDIAQKSTIVWEDEDDLIERLMKRIEATVGLNSKYVTV